MTIFYCGRRETAVDWEVKIADFVVLLGKDAKKVSDDLNLPDTFHFAYKMIDLG